ncbi:MAG: prepilin peptidase [Candidatus Melainabacteria bacterium]|nr:prepilin peptidase [Candidatus Melainabacteria bacterium]
MIQNIILLIVSLTGGIFDWTTRKIPNWLTFGTLAFMLLFNTIYLRSEILNSLLGFLVGLALLFIPYLLGLMGAGDVKLLGAIGSIVGFKKIVLIFLYSSICGLFLGIVWLLFLPNRLKFLITTGQVLPAVDKKQKLPYGIAIFLGTFIYIMFGTNNFLKEISILHIWQ